MTELKIVERQRGLTEFSTLLGNALTLVETPENTPPAPTMYSIAPRTAELLFSRTERGMSRPAMLSPVTLLTGTTALKACWKVSNSSMENAKEEGKHNDRHPLTARDDTDHKSYHSHSGQPR